MDYLGKGGVFLRRVAAWMRRGRRDDVLREEIAAHVEARRRQLIADGMDPRDAAFEAKRMFGNVTVIREETRDMWGFRWIDSLVQDARFGARLLVRTPLFTAAAVLSLGIGIGSAVAVFNVADAVLFRTLAVRAPGELKGFRLTMTAGAMSKTIGGVNDDSLARIQEGADFGEFAGFRTADEVEIAAPGVTTRFTRVEFVSGTYFDILGVTAAGGRMLASSDGDSSPLPVVLSERLWRATFGSDPSAVGRSITLNGQPSTVIGIVRRFRGLVSDQPADVFAPLSAAARVDPTVSNFVIRLVGRIDPGVSSQVAEQKLLPLYLGPEPSNFTPENFRITLPDASRGMADAREPLRRPLWLGLGLVAILLVVACANTGGLLLSRYSARRAEFGVRIAIGAARWRLARQLAVEALLVASLAAAVGLAVGAAAAPLLVRVMPQAETPAAFDLRFDLRLVGFTMLVAAACAAGAAAASLFQLWRSDPSGLLGGDTRTTVTGARRATRVLIAAQVACSLLLVIGAVAMGRTLLNLRQVSLGFNPERTIVVTVNARGLADPAAMSAYHGRLHDRLAAARGVAASTMAQIAPLSTSATTGTVDVPGFTPAVEEDRVTRMFFVGPAYFETLGMAIVAGTALPDTANGSPRTRVAVVNERFASFYFGSAANAIGRTVNRDTRIVGVVADARYNTVRDEIPRAMFVPYTPLNRPQMSHIVRATGDPATAITAVREAVTAHDPRLRPRIIMATDLLGAGLARERFFATIAVTLSALALLLACTGLYAAVAYAVSRRSGELAVRLALGASASDIMSLVLKDPLRTTLAGVAVGLPAAYVTMRSAGSLLYGVSPFDPLTVAACSLSLLGAGVLAALWPARRATRIDPLIALKAS